VTESSGGDVARIGEFDAFFAQEGSRLYRALVAAFGERLGADLFADSMLTAWNDWERIRQMRNPLGFLWRVAQSSSRRYRRWERPPQWPAVEVTGPDRYDDVDLRLSLQHLSDAERIAVVMVHAQSATYREVAEHLGVPVTTVNNLVHRALRRLRADLR